MKSYLNPIIAQSIKHWTPKPLPKQPSAHIRHDGSDWLVYYDHQPAERMTLEYPGCPSSVEVCEVFLLNNTDKADWSRRLSDDSLSDLQTELLRQLEES